MFSSALQDSLKRKHVLLDNCVLSFVLQHSDHKFTEELLTELLNLHCPIVTNDLIKLEFMRDSRSVSKAIEKKTLIAQICEMSMPIKNLDLYNDSVIVSNIYKNKSINGIEIVDLLISSFLKEYPTNLVLLTTNHKDFPLILHDRLGTVSFDREQDIQIFGFYQFNMTKYKKCFEHFLKVKDK